MSPFAATPDVADRLKLLLQSTGKGVFGIDIACHCTFVNRAAAQMLGRSTDTVLGHHMHALMHHSQADGRHCPDCDCPILKAFRRGLPCGIDDDLLWRADGSALPAECSSHPVIEGGQVQGAVLTVVDSAERKRAIELLQRSHDELERRVAERTRELRDLARHLETVREGERIHIAGEIHHEPGSLLVALKWQAQEFIESSELDATLQCHVAVGVAVGVAAGVAAGVAPPAGGLAIAVFRIVQEMLCNVARHAKARSVYMLIAVDDLPEPALSTDVRDDGVGANAAALADAQSFGVMGMREGSITVASMARSRGAFYIQFTAQEQP